MPGSEESYQALVAEASPTGGKVAECIDGLVAFWSVAVHDIVQSVETGVSAIYYDDYDIILRDRRALHDVLRRRDKTGEVGTWVSGVLDQAFLAVTEPDTGQVLQRANLLFPMDDPASEPWLSRLPKRGPIRDVLEEWADSLDRIRRSE
jgi:hypothetical protein